MPNKNITWQKNTQNLILPKINQYDLILQISMIQAKKKRKEMAYFNQYSILWFSRSGEIFLNFNIFIIFIS